MSGKSKKSRKRQQNSLPSISSISSSSEVTININDINEFPALTAQPNSAQIAPILQSHHNIPTVPFGHIGSIPTPANIQQSTRNHVPERTPLQIQRDSASASSNSRTNRISTVNNSAEPKPKATREEKVIDKLCEIILTMHQRKEYVAVINVEQELFQHFDVKSYRELRVDPRKLTPLTNLIERNKNVTLYMQVFERVFNLCTLHDLGSMLARFLKIPTYESAHLGPLDKHPEINRVFDYKRPISGNPILQITTSDVINRFLDFEAKYNSSQRIPFERFLDDLVQQYKLENREELGIFCRSFPYLTEITRKLTREHRIYSHQSEKTARENIKRFAEQRFEQLFKELQTKFHISLDNGRPPSPTIVFGHLISTVEKYLAITEQEIVKETLDRFRKDEFLQCLFNISICLGTIEQPNDLVAQLSKFYRYPTMINPMQPAPIIPPLMTQHSNSPIPNRLQPSMPFKQQGTKSDGITRKTVDPSFVNTLPPETSVHKPPIPYQQLCADLSNSLTRFNQILTIKQWAEFEKQFCSQHGVENFFGFSMIDENAGLHCPLSLTTFLHLNRQKIDHDERLAIFENTTSVNNWREIYAFVNQLLRNYENRTEHFDPNRPIHLNRDQLSAIESAIRHKFGGSLSGFDKVEQIVKKAKQYDSHQETQIFCEELLLDVVSLNRINMTPSSLPRDEIKICELILQCPIMIDLQAWLHWPELFQPTYGSLKSFIKRKRTELDDLLLLETSTNELFRLPKDSSVVHFEQELAKMNVRSAVGYLCTSIIVEHVHVNSLPLSIYRQIMQMWFIVLQSSATFGNEPIEPMLYILEFLDCLPILIGQTLIVQELVLTPLDEVFRGNDIDRNSRNNREQLWSMANDKQKNKLETWGYLLDIKEWKNTEKWIGLQQQSNTSESIIKQSNVLKNMTNTTFHEYTPKFIEHNETANSVASITSSPEKTVQNVVADAMDKPINIEDETVKAAFEHIRTIRQGFGDNCGLSAEGQNVISNLHGLIERSLEKLSNDLYSEQGHFVLELVQNADDNRYSSDCLPTLRFVVSPERILVCNNEIGFQPMHISAICNIGASTKGKHKQGYAGHKGIGFKSVFMVSHAPEIYSGPYRFCFDTVNGTQQIGYIRPIWIDTPPKELLPPLTEWRTCIRLPIRQDKRDGQLQRNFDDVQPILLLFLNRLRRIEIVKENNNNQTVSSSIFTRIDHAQGKIIELQEETSQTEGIVKHYWLVVKKVVHVPRDIKTKLSDVKCDVESTTIAVAYPLNPIFDESSRQVLSTQPLFAYLPLRSYGFRFILQADFEIPASRQEILRDNRWNDWLKTEIIQLFSLVYDQFLNLSDLFQQSPFHLFPTNNALTKIQTLKYFLKLMPTRNEIDPYFNTFVDKCIQGLMGIIRLPVCSHDDESEQTIDWVLPSQCVLVRDLFIRKIFSHTLLLSHFNSYYLHDEFVKECDEHTLIKLGCRRLDFTDILRLIRTLYKQNDQVHSTKTTTIEQRITFLILTFDSYYSQECVLLVFSVAQWLLCIDYSLQQERERPSFNMDYDENRETTTMAELKQLKIIPLRNQTRLVSLDEFDQRTVLFPPDKSIKFAKHLQIVFEDLPTIDERLLNYIEDKYPRRFDSVKALLTDLGVCDARNVQRIYSNHILPVVSDDSQWSKKSDTTLIAYLICIYKEIYAQNPDKFDYKREQLKTKMIIKTRDGKFVRLGSDNIIVHLTSIYGCQNSLESLKLPNYQFTFISDDYIQAYQKELFYIDSERRKFLTLLKDLDLCESFQIQSNEKGFLFWEQLYPNRTVRFHLGFADASQLAGTPWSDQMVSLSESVHEPFFIKDWHSEELDMIISSKDNDIPQSSQLITYLQQAHQCMSMYYAASVKAARSKHTDLPPIMAIPSSVVLSLRQKAWIPVDGGQLFKPTEVYCLHPKNPFRRYLPHLDTSKIKLIKPDFIFNILGIKQDVTTATVFELFMKWSCNLDRDSLYEIIKQHTNDSNTNEPIPCTLLRTNRQSCLDNIKNISEIYQILISNEENCTIFGRFRLWPLIFVPRTTTMGDFLYVDEVLWHDPYGLFNTNNHHPSAPFALIKPFYESNPLLARFFIEILRIKPQPTLNDYLSLLSNTHNKTHEYIWQCIDVVIKLAFKENKQKLVQDHCAELAFIPCLNGIKPFCKYSDPLFYPHDMKIAKLFADKLLIVFPSERICTPHLQQMFCTLFKIRNLTDFIKATIEGDNECPSIDLTSFYAHAIGLIQRYLFHNKLISETRSNYLQSVLARMEIFYVDRITVSYSYNNGEIQTPKLPSSIPAHIDESSGKFIVMQTVAQQHSHINTMAFYLLDDNVMRSRLIKLITEFYMIFKQYGQNGVTKIEPQSPLIPSDLQWKIPSIANSHLSEPMIVEDDNNEKSHIQISNEDKEKLKNEATCLPEKLQPVKKVTEESKPLISMPAHINPAKSLFPSNETTRIDQPKPVNDRSTISDRNGASSVNNTKTTGENTKIPNADKTDESSSGEQNSFTNKQSISNNTPKQTVTKAANSIAQPPTDEALLERTFAPAHVSRSTTATSSFECICVTNIRNFNISPSSIQPSGHNSNPTNTDDDLKTGRCGEYFVFRYLQWKYPGETVEWINKEKESFAPYDILLTREANKKQQELIEVKTTRSSHQNSFHMSVGEIECLLQNEKNYSIYRVYYNDDEKSSTITILNDVKFHLQKKDLLLSMTISTKS